MHCKLRLAGEKKKKKKKRSSLGEERRPGGPTQFVNFHTQQEVYIRCVELNPPCKNLARLNLAPTYLCAS